MPEVERWHWAVALVATVAILSWYYVPPTFAPQFLNQSFFQWFIGAVEFPGGTSLTHGYASASFLATFVVLSLWYERDFVTNHKVAFLTVAVGAAIFAISDWNEFSGPYLPWVSLGSLLSIPVGAWIGILTVGVVED